MLGFISGLLNAQNDAISAVFKVFPENGHSAYPPVFSPFCLSSCWLGDREFDLLSRHFVPKDSVSCIPKSAQRFWHGASASDLNPTRLWWKADPYDPNLFWTKEYREDDRIPWQDRVQTLILWRYHQQTAKQDSFISLTSADFTLGKAGVWVCNSKELVLLDRHSGQVIQKAENPFGPGRSMNLQPWGDDLIVSEQWLYQVEKGQFVPFFPLPLDLEGCKSPEKVEFQGELCLSLAQAEGSKYTFHLLAPGQSALTLPIEPRFFSYQGYLLANNPPLAWFCVKDTLIGFDYTTGEWSAYPGSSEEPLHGNHEGRFLGFYSENGLSFFDKYSCQFRVLPQPYGHKMPRNFTNDGQRIFLTFEDHWEIVQFDKLPSTFPRSTTLEDYAAFEAALNTWAIQGKSDFYRQYEAFFSLYDPYKARKNPKIEERKAQIVRQFADLLQDAPTEVVLQVAKDFAAGRLDTSLHCALAQGLFKRYGQEGRVEEAMFLLPILDNEPCHSAVLLEYEYLVPIVKRLQFQLDSIARARIPQDEKLYATGKAWFEFCLKKRWFWYTSDPRADLEQAFSYYRKLLDQFPQSPWADDVVYDMFHYIDYHSTASDDETPDGNDQEAAAAFRKFLDDYPNAERSPEVMLRLAKCLIRQMSPYHANPETSGKAAEYLRMLALKYPEFVATSEDYKTTESTLKTNLWTEHWTLKLAVSQASFQWKDSIWVTVSLQNHSQSAQTLDSSFLDRWQEGLYLHLHPIRGKGCEEIWGDFQMISVEAHNTQSVIVPAGASFSEKFVLARSSVTRSYGSRKFDLAPGTTYLYGHEYQHPALPWIKMSCYGGRFSIE